MHAIVIGAGIGGLATAIALGRRGWSVELLERQRTLAATGSALVLWPNALHALRALGVGEKIEAVGTAIHRGGSRSPSGRWLSSMDAQRVADRLGAPLVAVHRADLHRILAEALPDTVTVRTGQSVDAVAGIEADLLVGADGVGSTVRAAYAPATAVRDSGQVAWRAVVQVPAPEGVAICETLGRGWRFGAAPLGAHGVYWFAAAPGPLRTSTKEEQLQELRKRFTGWHKPIPDLLAATDPALLLHHSLADLHPLPPMQFAGRTALVGDAAHATTPNLGQGAGLALEDAVVLAHALDAGLSSGLAHYDRIRRPRAAKVVARSRQAGTIAGAQNRFTSALRDLLLLALPDRVAESSAASLADWRPPAPAGSADQAAI